jgi:hypothetical protein
MDGLSFMIVSSTSLEYHSSFCLPSSGVRGRRVHTESKCVFSFPQWWRWMFISLHWLYLSKSILSILLFVRLLRLSFLVKRRWTTTITAVVRCVFDRTQQNINSDSTTTALLQFCLALSLEHVIGIWCFTVLLFGSCWSDTRVTVRLSEKWQHMIAKQNSRMFNSLHLF